PHNFYWFSLPPPTPIEVGSLPVPAVAVSIPTLPPRRSLPERFERGAWDDLEPYLPSYLARRGVLPNGSRVNAARVLSAFKLAAGDREIWSLTARIEFNEGSPETYSIPL